METIYRPALLPSLIQIDKPTMRQSPTAIGQQLINQRHASARLLQYLISQHPRRCSDNELVSVCGYTGNAYAALAWHVMRVNDTLPLVGWKIEVDGADRHSLVPITDAHHQRLVERYEARRVA